MTAMLISNRRLKGWWLIWTTRSWTKHSLMCLKGLTMIASPLISLQKTNSGLSFTNLILMVAGKILALATSASRDAEVGTRCPFFRKETKLTCWKTKRLTEKLTFTDRDRPLLHGPTEISKTPISLYPSRVTRVLTTLGRRFARSLVKTPIASHSKTHRHRRRKTSFLTFHLTQYQE